MSHQNERPVRELLEAFGARDMERLGSLFAEDATVHIVGQNQLAGDHRGRDQTVALFRRFSELTDGTWRAELHDLMASDEHAVALLIRTGERDGRKGRFPATIVYHLADGMLKDMWVHEVDQYGFDEFFA